MSVLRNTIVTAILLACSGEWVYAVEYQRMRDLRTRADMLARKSDPAVIYVNQASRSARPDGNSWETAYRSLSDALNADLVGKSEIWVARGTYHPTAETDRNASFSLLSGRDLYGGFLGNEVRREQRNWKKNVTILSGEIGDFADMTDNVYHVVTGADDVILDGFTIRDGYAMSSDGEVDETGVLVDVPDDVAAAEILRIVTNIRNSSGGGLLNVHAGPEVRNCRFTNNYAIKGGAVYNMVTRSWAPGNPESTVTGDSPTFQNCFFDKNYARARGGAVNNDFFTTSLFLNTIFSNNVCEGKGGAIYADMGSPVQLINVIFYRNEAERGGALVADGVSPHRAVYTTFLANRAYDIGSALYQGTYMGDQRDGEPFIGNEVHLYKSLVIGNTSESSTTSISNWHDSVALFDETSVVETTEGSFELGEYLVSGTYMAKDKQLGWHPARKVDTEYWLALLSEDSNRTYTAPDYDTQANVTGSSTTLFVDQSAKEGGDGSSWEAAFSTLSAALDNALPGAEIWVASGTYLPTAGTDRTQSFVMKEGVSIYGGFSGEESDIDARDLLANPTILSGDIGVVGDSSDNAYHVLIGASEAVIDGFVIQDGYGDGDFHHSRGGGILCYDMASPEIRNCTFLSNSAFEGGAIAAYGFSAPTISQCLFEKNAADSGGALLFRMGPDSTESGALITDSSFLDNSAMDRGGAVYIDYGAWPSFARCTLSGNISSGNGGAVYVDNNSSQLSPIEARFTSTDITGNNTGLRGGGLNIYEGTVYLESCMVTGNSAGTGGGGVALDYFGRLINVENSTVVVQNSSSSGEDNIDDATDERFESR